MSTQALPPLRRYLPDVEWLKDELNREANPSPGRRPGLPKKPASDNIDIDADGNIVGLA
jgi:hypothetical protein